MLIQTQSLTLHPHPHPSILSHKPISQFSPLKSLINNKNPNFNKTQLLKNSFQPLKCCPVSPLSSSSASSSSSSSSSSTVTELPQQQTDSLIKKPTSAEVCRTIMELSSLGTLSTVTQEGWPLGTGLHFSVDHEGTPILCLNASNRQFLAQNRSSLHVQLEQHGSRTTQCMLQGSLNKPEDKMVLQKLRSIWNKKFEEEVDEDLLYVLSVERVLQIEDLKEDGVWVNSSEYKSATPDPLRDFAEKIVNEINMNHMEDFERICNIYLSLGFQVTRANLIWVDRLGFDVHLRSAQNEIFEARIPFPREVSDEKGVKSSFNCMSQHAWEVDRSYTQPDFEKSNILKQIR